ncbi:MAG TPA: hypothetical protein VFQ39_09245, partial [Longimicrobium sp.]|nr:hypothetical protein [Longimicrobium sp.]
MPDATPPDAPPPTTLGQTPHEPTVRPWELELLISGAVTFALMQLPGRVDAAFRALDPHLDVGGGMAVFMAYYVTKLVLYALIMCFLAHLAMRAYWVGLIGLESVYPRGVKWDETRLGPIAREEFRARLPPLQTMIDRADRVASVIFSSAFVIVFILAMGVVLGAFCWGLAWVISRVLPVEVLPLFTIILFLLSFFPAMVSAFDRRWSPKLGQRGRARVRRLTVGSYYLGAMPLYGTAVMLLTGGRRRRSSLVFGVAFLLLFGVFLVKDVFLARGVIRGGSYAYFPEQAGRFGADPRYYRDQRRDGESYENTPSIQSDVVREPYVRLFIPYYPIRHNHVFAARCRGLPRVGEAGIDLADDDPVADSVQLAVLACWSRVQAVKLNGRPLAVPFRFSTDP